MKEEPKFQKQHQIPQVYLRHFGFKKDETSKKNDCITVLNPTKGHSEIVDIIDFTVKTNIYDMPFVDDKHKRHFENESNRVENEYNKIINNCTYAFQINPKDETYLEAFVAGMICRSIFNRDLFIDRLKNTTTRDKFINEITLFTDDKKELETLLSQVPLEHHINIVLGHLMEHLCHMFLFFNKIILKSPKGYSWSTSDNPVVIDRKELYDWTIPSEAELYFPLSKDFCLFMYHKKNNKSDNPLKKLPINRVSNIDFKTFDNIMMSQIAKNIATYYIFGEEIEPINS